MSIEASVRAERDDLVDDSEEEDGTREAGRETGRCWAGFDAALNEEVL